MKRLIALILSMIFIFCSCTKVKEDAGKYKNFATTGVWISFSEINNMLASERGFEAELEEAVENCRKLNIENVYIHVRSYCDSLYPSKYFPLVKNAELYDYDVFQKMLDAFHEYSIKVHAWVNPYRVLTSASDINKLSTDSPAYKWMTDENKENNINVCFYNGIYLNPSENEVQKLIIDSLKEIITRYDVDGIHFDDYFYPTQSIDFDKESYEKYTLEATKPLKLYDWRRANVNSLISSCYSAIKFHNENILFSISPAASIEKNYSELYADVEEWITNGYIDVIIPQLYFGFDYSDKAYSFDVLCEEWKKLCRKNDAVDLVIGLASYKIGTVNENDGEEWRKSDDIISRQAEICFNDSAVNGYVIFSYNSIFSKEALNTRQRENLLEFINNSYEVNV